MQIKRLDITVYEQTGWDDNTRKIQHPTWREIEEAIRDLDRFTHPFVLFYLNEDAAEYDQPDFEIVGGDGRIPDARQVGRRNPTIPRSIW